MCVILFILSNKIHCCDFADLNIFHFMPFIFGKWLPLTPPPPPPLCKPISLQKFPFNSSNTIFWVNQFLILAHSTFFLSFPFQFFPFRLILVHEITSKIFWKTLSLLLALLHFSLYTPNKQQQQNIQHTYKNRIPFYILLEFLFFILFIMIFIFL